MHEQSRGNILAQAMELASLILFHKLPIFTLPMAIALLRGFAAALVLAVVVGMITSCGYGILRILLSHGQTSTDTYAAFVFLALNAAYLWTRIALPTIIFAAIPHVLLSLKLHRTSLRYYVVSGAFIGFTAVAVMTAWKYLYPMPPYRLSFDAYFSVFSAMLTGALAALAFWLVVRPQNLVNGGVSGWRNDKEH